MAWTRIRHNLKKIRLMCKKFEIRWNLFYTWNVILLIYLVWPLSTPSRSCSLELVGLNSGISLQRRKIKTKSWRISKCGFKLIFSHVQYLGSIWSNDLVALRTAGPVVLPMLPSSVLVLSLVSSDVSCSSSVPSSAASFSACSLWSLCWTASLCS